MKQAIAVFDIDGTILKGISGERLFLRYLLKKGELHTSDAVNCLIHFFTTFTFDWWLATKGNKNYIKNKNKKHIERLAEKCFKEKIIPRISQNAQKKIDEHREAALKIVLLSGTPDFLLRFFHSHLKADFSHGSNLTVDNDVYTGKINGTFPFGKAKARIIKNNYPAESYDLSASYAYADHYTDFHFLNLFGHPFIVNPDSRLKTGFQKRGISPIMF